MEEIESENETFVEFIRIIIVGNRRSDDAIEHIAPYQRVVTRYTDGLRE